jgi:glutamate racemase
MGRVAVFDSGLGSLSIIMAIRKVTKAEIIYFADQKHYPYGKKSSSQLRQIIESSIKLLKKKFNPDVIVVGSNTPTILFEDLFMDKAIIGVSPPLSKAIKITKTKSIAILATSTTINSSQLDRFIANNVPTNISVIKIDATKLIDLVETGKFLNDVSYCKNKIPKYLCNEFSSKNIDVVTLSSTHLSFLNSILTEMFPTISFLDPALDVAKQITKMRNFSPSQKNSLKIFSSSNTTQLQNHLSKLKIKNTVQHLEF